MRDTQGRRVWRTRWRLLLPAVAVLMAGFVRPCAALQYSYAPNIFDAEPYYDSSSDTEEGDWAFTFRLLGSGKITGSSWLFLGGDSEDLTAYDDHSFRGRTIGKAIVRVYADPRGITDRTKGIVIVPSSRQVRVRMTSPEGIVISGVFQSSLHPNTTRYPGYPAVGLVRMRFHGTISNPAILGLKKKTFTLKRTYYLNKDYLSEFYRP